MGFVGCVYISDLLGRIGLGQILRLSYFYPTEKSASIFVKVSDQLLNPLKLVSTYQFSKSSISMKILKIGTYIHFPFYLFKT